MRKSTILLKMMAITLISFLATSLALAQPAMPDMKKATPEQRAEYQTGLMKSKLNLDDSQATKAQAINLKYAQKMQPIINSTDSKFSKVKRMMSIQKDKDAELEKVFTKDQFKQYKDFESEMRSKMMSKMQGSN